MRQYIGISAGLLLLGFATIGPAAAQAVYPRPPGFLNPALPAYEIMRVVSAHGLTPLTRPVWRGRNYVLLATDKSGQEMRVEVDARLGDIVGLRAPIPGEPYGAPIGAAALPPATVGGALPPRPIPSVPNPRVGAAPPPAPVAAHPDAAPPLAAPPPSRTAAVQPNLPPLPPPPPLPRPRPKLTAAEAAPETPPEPAAAKPRPPGVPAARQPPKESAGEIE